MRLIMKFGGRAVDSGEKVLHVANLIKNYKNRGREIVAVFSAVDGMTDEILRVSESVK
jgi:aspartokinase